MFIIQTTIIRNKILTIFKNNSKSSIINAKNYIDDDDNEDINYVNDTYYKYHYMIV
jgi:hypothetical protein